MTVISRTTAVLALAAALMVPGLARATHEHDMGNVDAVAADAAPASQAQAMPMGRGMGMQGMGCKSMGAGGGCKMGKPGEMGKGKRACRSMGGGDDSRIGALEKRLDAMQMTLELLTRQQLDGDKQ